MSALTDRIAAGHQLKWLPPEHAVRVCGCGLVFKLPMSLSASNVYAEHIAAVTEAAVREQVARDIEANYLGPDFGRNPITGQDSPHAMLAEAYDEGLFDAARIARGGAA